MELWLFYLLAFTLSWAGWIPQTLSARGVIAVNSPLLALLGGGGPTLAAVFTLLLLKKRERIPELFRPLFQFRSDAVSYLFTLGYWFLIAALALGLGIATGLFKADWQAFAWGSFIPLLITMILSNVWEEIGWRGFALPRFEQRWSDMTTALIMGLLWQLWHLPLMLDPTSPMSGLPWVGELAFTLSLSVIYIWLYRRTQRSLAFVTLFHALSNTVAFILLTMGVFIASYGLVAGFTVLTALGILIRYGTRRFGAG